MPHRHIAVLSALLVSLHIAGCGGSGGATATPTTTTTPVTYATIEPACTGCAATSATTYAGSGTGVWQYTNSGTASVPVPVSISGLTGQDVQLVMTNETQNDIAMPSNAFLNMSSSITQSSRSEHFRTPMEASIAEFNRKGWHDAILDSGK